MSQNPNPRFVIDGTNAPFVIFDTLLQRNLPWRFGWREAAEFVLKAVDAVAGVEWEVLR